MDWRIDDSLQVTFGAAARVRRRGLADEMRLLRHSPEDSDVARSWVARRKAVSRDRMFGSDATHLGDSTQELAWTAWAIGWGMIARISQELPQLSWKRGHFSDFQAFSSVHVVRWRWKFVGGGGARGIR